jgi:hypothetical protein
MHPVRLSLLLISLLFTNACAALTITPEISANTSAPALMLKLPKTVESFDMQGFKYFNDGSGYSIRYSNERKQRLADLYIYDVADENASLDHKQLVLGSTRAPMDAIGAAAEQGHYANYNVLDAATHAQGLRTVARVQATYLRQNLASYTLVYQTEHKGTLLKIRVTMPDNDSNRNSNEWDLFTNTVFQSVISELDKESLVQVDATDSSEL